MGNKKPDLEERLKVILENVRDSDSEEDAVNYLLQGVDLISKSPDKDTIQEQILQINSELQRYLKGPNLFTRRKIMKYFADSYGKNSYNQRGYEGGYK